MHLILLGPIPTGFRESSGPLLAKALGVPRIFIGDLLRAHIHGATELGRQARQLMDAGQLISDELLTAMLRDSLIRAPHPGFLLDGHPLSVNHAGALDEMLDKLGTPLDAAVRLRLSEQEVKFHVHRITGRRLCRNDSQHVFQPSDERQAIDSLCAICGGELYQRQDDNKEVARLRLEHFAATMGPISDHYAGQGLLVTVDAAGTPQELAARVVAALREHGASRD